MADFVYLKFAEALATGFGFNPLTTAIGYAFVNETGGGTVYTPSRTAHEFLSSVPLASRMHTGVLDNATRTVDGTGFKIVIDADDEAIASVSGSKIDSVIFFVNTGSDATARLICRYDSWTGLPFTPSGGPLAMLLPNSANKLISIVG